MSAQLDALNVAVAKIQTDVDTAISMIATLKNDAANGVDPVAVQVAADALSAASSKLDAALAP